MQIQKKFRKGHTLVVFLCLFATSACEIIDNLPFPGGGSSKKNILEVVANDSDLHLLAVAIARAGLEEALIEGEELTVFAPNNAAFQALGFENAEAIMEADPEILRDVLLYHVAEGEFKSKTFDEGISIHTLIGADVFINTALAPHFFVNGNTEIIKKDIRAKNGVIQKIDQVLIQPTLNLAEIVVNAAQDENTPEFRSLLAAVQVLDLVETLSGEENFTVFAPSDAAFEAFFRRLGVDFEEVPQALLQQVILYHVVAGTVFSTDLREDVDIPTLREASYRVERGEGNRLVLQTFNLSEISLNVRDIFATNGVIHQIDEVLINPEDFTLGQLVQLGKDLSLLELGVEVAGLSEALNNPEAELTVFIPNDAAFANTGLDENALSTLSAEQINDVISYHAVASPLASLSEGPIVTLEEQAFFLALNDDPHSPVQAFINPSNPEQNIAVTVPQMNRAKNGFFYLLDKVILTPELQFPENGTLSDLLINLNAQGSFTQLTEAVLKVDQDPATQAGLVQLFSTEGPFTLFAPTDQAFENLYARLGVSGISEIDASALLAVLQYHVVGASAAVYSTDLSPGEVTMLAGGNITVDFEDGKLVIIDEDEFGIGSENALGVSLNIVTSNGVAHAISQVLIP